MATVGEKSPFPKKGKILFPEGWGRVGTAIPKIVVPIDELSKVCIKPELYLQT